MIPVVDLSRRLGRFEEAYIESVRRVMQSGTILLGPELDSFEREAVFGHARAHLVVECSRTYDGRVR